MQSTLEIILTLYSSVGLQHSQAAEFLFITALAQTFLQPQAHSPYSPLSHFCNQSQRSKHARLTGMPMFRTNTLLSED
jgi:hypothetical protein